MYPSSPTLPLPDSLPISCSPIRTRAIANTAVLPTAAFQFDRDAVPEPEILLASLVETLGRVHITAVDATALALGLTGDTISANLIVVGMAVQLGLLPLKPDSIEQAIKLNGVATKLNKIGRAHV